MSNPDHPVEDLSPWGDGITSCIACGRPWHQISRSVRGLCVTCKEAAARNPAGWRGQRALACRLPSQNPPKASFRPFCQCATPVLEHLDWFDAWQCTTCYKPPRAQLTAA